MSELRQAKHLIPLLLLILFVAACGGGSSNTMSTATTHGHGHSHDSTTREAVEPYPSVSLRVVADPGGGWLINSVPTNFLLAPQRVSTSHIDGEGHMHLYIDGVKISRIYGEWHQMPPLAAGSHVVRVELSANDHAVMTRNGAVIDASITLDVSAEQATNVS